MRAALITIILVGCSDTKQSNIDATMATDANVLDASLDASIDAPTLALDCPTYCAEMRANCTGTNAQYPDVTDVPDACATTCATFTVGTSTTADLSGNTLGCRIHYAGTTSVTADKKCVYAGPVGDFITASDPNSCSRGDVCASFCALEIKACGTLIAPLPGDPKDSTSRNPVYQYGSIDDCLSSCSRFDKTQAYRPGATGDTLACRISEAINASLSIDPGATTHCMPTGSQPTAPCANP